MITAWQCISTELTVKGLKKCCIYSGMAGTDDMLWNVRSECGEAEGTDCEGGDSDTDW
jgi:hypothetical protein